MFPPLEKNSALAAAPIAQQTTMRKPGINSAGAIVWATAGERPRFRAADRRSCFRV
jgi:hypothetical protein